LVIPVAIASVSVIPPHDLAVKMRSAHHIEREYGGDGVGDRAQIPAAVLRQSSLCDSLALAFAFMM
jgi:hypothetical protein